MVAGGCGRGCYASGVIGCGLRVWGPYDACMPRIRNDIRIAVAVIVLSLLGVAAERTFRHHFLIARVQTASMDPTVPFASRVLVRRTKTVRRGDVVMYVTPRVRLRDLGRIVAAGGDTVELRDKQLFVNGRARREPYAVHRDTNTYPKNSTLFPQYGTRDNFDPFVVPKGCLFILGDHRDQSPDARTLGVVAHRAVIGRVVLVSAGSRLHTIKRRPRAKAAVTPATASAPAR
jgi:signal peptidase I